MDNYKIIKGDSVLITSNSSFISFYETSKGIISEYASIIEENVNAIKTIESKIKEFEAFEDQKIKTDLVKYLNEYIIFKYQHSFFLHFSMDFSICIRELMLASTKIEQLFYTKVIYIDLYRFLERHNTDLGVIRKLSNASDDYKEYHNIYMDFRDKYYHEIKENRNLLFAHFDSDVKYDRYFNLTENIDAEVVAKMCITFFDSQLRLSSIYLSLDKDFKRVVESYVN